MTKTTDELRADFQSYYDRVDVGDAANAVTVYTPDVYWAHFPTTKKDLGLSHTEPDIIVGREEVQAYLARVLPRSVEAGLVHTVENLVCDGDEGAYIGRTTSTVSDDVNNVFIVWFRLRDGLVSEYSLHPFMELPKGD